MSDPRNTVFLVPFPLWAGKEREEMKAVPGPPTGPVTRGVVGKRKKRERGGRSDN